MNLKCELIHSGSDFVFDSEIQLEFHYCRRRASHLGQATRPLSVSFVEATQIDGRKRVENDENLINPMSIAWRMELWCLDGLWINNSFLND